MFFVGFISRFMYLNPWLTARRFGPNVLRMLKEESMTEEEFNAKQDAIRNSMSELKRKMDELNKQHFLLKKEYADAHAPIKSGDLFDLPYGKTTRRYRMEWVVPDYCGYEGQATLIKKNGTDGDSIQIYSWAYQKAKKV